MTGRNGVNTLFFPTVSTVLGSCRCEPVIFSDWVEIKTRGQCCHWSKPWYPDVGKYEIMIGKGKWLATWLAFFRNGTIDFDTSPQEFEECGPPSFDSPNSQHLDGAVALCMKIWEGWSDGANFSRRVSNNL